MATSWRGPIRKAGTRRLAKLPLPDRTFVRRLGLLWSRASQRVGLIQGFLDQAEQAATRGQTKSRQCRTQNAGSAPLICRTPTCLFALVASRRRDDVRLGDVIACRCFGFALEYFRAVAQPQAFAPIVDFLRQIVEKRRPRSQRV
jgi:hypothetical protein